jgi:hypothetical protein
MSFRSILFAGAALVAFATSGSAVPMQAVFSGQINTAYGVTNSFGLTTIEGADYSLTYRYDPSSPSLTRNSQTGEYDQTLGTSGSSATLTVNGQSVTLFDNFNLSMYLLKDNNSVAFSVLQDSGPPDAPNVVSTNYAQTLINYGTDAIPANLETAFSLANVGVGTYGAFRVDGATTGTIAGLLSINRLEVIVIGGGVVAPTTGPVNPLPPLDPPVIDPVVIDTTAPPSPVPIPAALPLLAGALGGLGVIARRKKKAKTAG